MKHAVKTLEKGGCVAYPTETCWGLGVRADSVEAVEHLRDLKGRSKLEPFSVLIENVSWLDRLGVVISDEHRKLMAAFWPGPLTLLFRVKPDSAYAHLAAPLLGVRCSSHPLAAELVTRLGIPITSTSANRHGDPTCDSADQIRMIFGPVVYVLDADDGSDGASTVAACEGGLQILREGAISRAQLLAVLDADA